MDMMITKITFQMEQVCVCYEIQKQQMMCIVEQLMSMIGYVVVNLVAIFDL